MTPRKKRGVFFCDKERTYKMNAEKTAQMEQSGDVEAGQHQDAASSVIRLAHSAPQETESVATAPDQAANADSQRVPHRLTETWAISGAHPGWLGFDRTGNSKSG
jgi:hypothetical protein